MGAARRLNVDHTTVARHIQALEKEIGTSLFFREASGHRLTEAGRQLQPQVEAMDDAFRNIEKNTALPLDEDLSGIVRIGATEGFGTMVLAPALASFAREHPRLVIDLMAMPRLVHLSRSEADIVISLERPQKGPIVVGKLTDYRLHLYAHKNYLRMHGPVTCRDHLKGHTFITYVDDLLFSKELQYLNELYHPDSFALRSTSVLAQYQAVRASAGIAVLPAFLAERDHDLQRLLPVEACFTRTFWISFPTETKHLARMRAVRAFLAQTVAHWSKALIPEEVA